MTEKNALREALEAEQTAADKAEADIHTLKKERATLTNRLLDAERERDSANTRADNLRTFWMDERDFWKAECEAAKASRDAACHERDATIEALEKADRERDALKDENNKLGMELLDTQLALKHLQNKVLEVFKVGKEGAQ